MMSATIGVILAASSFSNCGGISSGPSPGNLDSAVLIPSAFIAGQRSLGSHIDKFVSLFRQFSQGFNSIVLSKTFLKCDRKNISQLDQSLI